PPSATAEMLVLSTAPAPTPEPAPAGAPGQPQGPRGPGGMMGTGMPGAAGGAGPFGRAGGDFPGAGAGGGFDGPLAPLGRGAGGPLGRGGPGGGASSKPANFNTPRGAVEAFLDALKARDLDRLTEATALHAEVEASAKNRPIFSSILDGSLGADQLDDI